MSKYVDQGRKWLPKTGGGASRVIRRSGATGGAFYSAKKWGGGGVIAPPPPLHLRPCVLATTAENFSSHTRTMPCSVLL